LQEPIKEKLGDTWNSVISKGRKILKRVSSYGYRVPLLENLQVLIVSIVMTFKPTLINNNTAGRSILLESKFYTRNLQLPKMYIFYTLLIIGTSSKPRRS
jgi:ABC-type microcin C transport system permease subunit YejE